MIFSFWLAIILSRIALVIAVIIVAVFFLAVCYVARDDDDLARQLERERGT